jgi:hypothetical protein
MTATATATATTHATAIKVEGYIWVTGKLLAAVGEDGWWQWISSSLSADFSKGRFLLAYFWWLGGGVQKKLQTTTHSITVIFCNSLIPKVSLTTT